MLFYVTCLEARPDRFWFGRLSTENRALEHRNITHFKFVVPEFCWQNVSHLALASPVVGATRMDPTDWLVIIGLQRTRDRPSLSYTATSLAGS